MKVKILDMNGNIKNIKRFPRPLGTTSLAIEYSLTPSDENRFRLYNHVIHQWLLSNGKFGGKYMDVNTLSQITGIPTDYIQCFMRDQVMNSKIWDKDKQEELINGLLGQTLAWALEDRLAIKSQVDLLRQSQNGHYTPFVSAELNKAMKMMLVPPQVYNQLYVLLWEVELPISSICSISRIMLIIIRKMVFL